MQYHISRQGQTYGPYPAEDVIRMLSEGRLLPTDLCWTEGMNEWQPVGEVFGAAPPPSPVPPPGPAAAPLPEPAAPAPPAAGAWMQAPPAMSAQPQRPAAAWGGAAEGWASAAAGPYPPDLHWLLVLLLAYVTCGIFGYVWMFIEANFVKKIDPASPARMFFTLYILIPFAAIAILILAQPRDGDTALVLFWVLASFVAIVLFFLGVFSMRRSLLHYYNTVENIGLRLDPVLTFLFNILYFQHHFSRVARWKRTGVLS
jgi:hypothetical protein